jgi:rubrerythrin
LRKILSSGTIGEYFDESLDYGLSETMDTPALSMAMKPADAFVLAMKKEEEAMRYYSKLAGGCKDAEKKKVFLDLAAMERGHKLKMEKAFVDVGFPEVW